MSMTASHSQTGLRLCDTPNPLLNRSRPRCSADGYAERDPAATVVIPPRSTAVPGSSAEPTQRDRHIQSIAENGRLGWQRETDYGKRSKAETAMSRYKRILGDHLHARKLSGQQAEAAIGVAVLNRMINAGHSDSVRIA
jgi:hypothetical protein